MLVSSKLLCSAKRRSVDWRNCLKAMTTKKACSMMYGLMTRVLLALKHSGGREQSDFARNYEFDSYIAKSFPSQGFLQELLALM